MTALTLAEIIKQNRELGSSISGEIYKIAVISNTTISQLKDVLEWTLRKEGINAEVEVGNYDNLVQDSISYAGHKAVIVFWEVANLLDGIASSIRLSSEVELRELEDRFRAEIQMVLSNLSSTPLVLFNKFSSRLFENCSLGDTALSRLCENLNNTLREFSKPNHITVSIDHIIGQLSSSQTINLRQFHTSKALYTTQFYLAYANAVKPAFLAANGRVKKVLVMDCDNTLWGGIIGEDGIGGISIGKNTPQGSIFHEAQSIFLALKNQGVLLALCSKNNPEDVQDALLNHPEMVIRDADIVAKKVNWKDKATNIKDLALELNVGLDSFVFVDDSDFEIGLVKKECPKVTCIQVPKNIYEYPQVARAVSLEFYRLSNTAEDGRKTEMYLEERERKNLANKFESIDDYLASLGLKIKFYWGKAVPIPRASQMTQKTNQFNLTTRRYTEEEIGRFINSPLHRLAVFSVKDNFGDSGVTGLIIISDNPEAPDECEIDSFLMSCRVLGRNIELKFFDEVIQKLKADGYKTIKAKFIPTSKNAQVSNFYEKVGFSPVDGSGEAIKYILNTEQYSDRDFPYIKVEQTNE